MHNVHSQILSYLTDPSHLYSSSTFPSSTLALQFDASSVLAVFGIVSPEQACAALDYSSLECKQRSTGACREFNVVVSCVVAVPSHKLGVSCRK